MDFFTTLLIDMSRYVFGSDRFVEGAVQPVGHQLPHIPDKHVHFLRGDDQILPQGIEHFVDQPPFLLRIESPTIPNIC